MGIELENKRLWEEKNKLTPRNIYDRVVNRSILERLMIGFLWFCFYLFIFGFLDYLWDNGSFIISSLQNFFYYVSIGITNLMPK